MQNISTSHSLSRILGIFLAMLACFFIRISAADLQIKFQHLDITSGLSQSSVYCFAQDKWGFIWIGTQDGLNRYDGYRFTVFKQSQSSISGSTINSLCSDKAGNLWISTGRGFDKLDTEKMRFSHYYHKEEDANTPASNGIGRLYEAPSMPGILWFDAGIGMDRLDVKKDTFIHYQHSSGDPNSLSSNNVSDLYEASSLPGTLWIGSDAGLNRMDMKSGRFLCYRHDPANPQSLSHDSVRTMYEASSDPGALWVGTTNGLNRMDMARGTFTVYRNDPLDPGSISSNRIAVIREFSFDPGVLWIGTDGGGLNRFGVSKKTFIRYLHDRKNPHTICDNFVQCMMEDRSGTAWIGTYGLGISTYSRYTKAFILYRSVPEDPNSLPTDLVRSICTSTKDPNILWIGTPEGVSRLDREKNQYTNYSHNNNDPGSLSSNLVRVVFEDSSGELWVGTSDGGLNHFLRDKGKFEHFRHDDANPDSLSSNSIRDIVEDPSGMLWIGVMTGGGLDEFDKKTKKFIHYGSDPSNPNSIRGIFSLCLDAKGDLWAGGNGVSCLNTKTGKVIRYVYDPNNPYSLSSGFVMCVQVDHSGTLWAGTLGGGVNRLDRKTGRFTHITEADGLANNVVYGILEDNSGNLWFSTNRGLSRYNPKKKTFKNFDVRDGLQSNEFNGGAFCKSRKGELFFGGIRGITAFFPEQIKDNPLVPPVLITDFQLFHKPVEVGQKIHNRVILEKNISDTREITLSYRDSFISFGFTALNFLSPDKNQYAYKMEGLEENWNHLGNERFVSYTTLPPGKYVFRVKASNNDGVWNKQGTSLVLRILPPFWKTWWFYTLCSLGLVLGAFAFYRQRVSHLERRRRELEIQVAERTQEILRQKEMIAEQNGLLEEANKELERLATHDGLTGLANRRHFFNFYEREWRRAVRNKRPISLIMGDIDFFKKCNDTHGHLFGDQCLEKLGKLMAENVHRPTDMAVRYGGEEFLIVLSETESPGAAMLAEKIRASVGSHSFTTGQAENYRLTISLGCATLTPKMDMDSNVLIKAADRAMYNSKMTGRNRVTVVSL